MLLRAGQAFVSAVILALPTGMALGQPFPGLDCPGKWIPYGGGMACQCADGTLASMVGNRVYCPTPGTRGEREGERLEAEAARQKADAEQRRLERIDEEQKVNRAREEAAQQRAERDRLAREAAAVEKAASDAASKRTEEERRIAELRSFAGQFEECRHYAVRSCEAALRSLHATEEDRKNLSSWRALGEKLEEDKTSCRRGSTAACQQARTSNACDSRCREFLKEHDSGGLSLHAVSAFFSSMVSAALGVAQTAGHAIHGLPLSTVASIAVSLVLCTVLVFVIRTRGRLPNVPNPVSPGLFSREPPTTMKTTAKFDKAAEDGPVVNFPGVAELEMPGSPDDEARYREGIAAVGERPEGIAHSETFADSAASKIRSLDEASAAAQCTEDEDDAITAAASAGREAKRAAALSELEELVKSFRLGK